MTLVTGTPVGTITESDATQAEGSAYIYYQNALAPELNRPDSDGFYWNLATTGTYGVYLLGCVRDVSLGGNLTVNSVRCDTVGDRDAIQKLNHLEVKFTLQTLFPLTMLSDFIHGSGAVHNAGAHKEGMGIGQVNNNIYYHVYMPKVYDDVAGSYVAFTIHRAKFVNTWDIAMKYGEPWQLTGVQLWGFADTNLPSGQQFATVIHSDIATL
jgi:hypothetical protein